MLLLEAVAKCGESYNTLMKDVSTADALQLDQEGTMIREKLTVWRGPSIVHDPNGRMDARNHDNTEASIPVKMQETPKSKYSKHPSSSDDAKAAVANQACLEEEKWHFATQSGEVSSLREVIEDSRRQHKKRKLKEEEWQTATQSLEVRSLSDTIEDKREKRRLKKERKEMKRMEREQRRRRREEEEEEREKEVEQEQEAAAEDEQEEQEEEAAEEEQEEEAAEEEQEEQEEAAAEEEDDEEEEEEEEEERLRTERQQEVKHQEEAKKPMLQKENTDSWEGFSKIMEKKEETTNMELDRKQDHGRQQEAIREQQQQQVAREYLERQTMKASKDEILVQRSRSAARDCSSSECEDYVGTRRQGSVESDDEDDSWEYPNESKRWKGGEVLLANILEGITVQLRDAKVISYLFQRPVKKSEAPDYLDVIEHPMDLSKILEKARNCVYKSRQEFRRDVLQIQENAHIYNEVRNPHIPPLADKLLELCDQLLEAKARDLDEAESRIERSGEESSHANSPKATNWRPSRRRYVFSAP